MKYEMKHARKQDKAVKKVAVKGKAAAIILSSMAGIAVIVFCVINFRVISRFMDSRTGIPTDIFVPKITEESQEIADNEEINNVSADNNEAEALPEEELPGSEEESQTEDKEETGKSIPAIELEIYEGPLYSSPDDICFYRVRAIVTGEPSPRIIFSKDDSLGSLGPDRVQVNLSRDNKTYTLTATAANSEGEASDTLPLTWDCNRGPDIKSISPSSDTLYPEHFGNTHYRYTGDTTLGFLNGRWAPGAALS